MWDRERQEAMSRTIDPKEQHARRRSRATDPDSASDQLGTAAFRSDEIRRTVPLLSHEVSKSMVEVKVGRVVCLRCGRRSSVNIDDRGRCLDRAACAKREVETRSGKSAAAVALGRMGGLVGGHARAKKLSPERRSAIARQAARARWDDR